MARGGDTDTNAAISGGLLGAIVGFKNLPYNFIKKSMELDFLDPKLIWQHTE